MSFKSGSEEWVRKGPIQAIALIAAAGIVVGGLVGLGAGYKIEQNRTRSDVKRLEHQIQAGGVKAASGALGQRVGKVTAYVSGSITVSTKQRGTQVLTTTPATAFEKAVKAKLANVVAGSRILVTRAGDEIIVLPTTSKLGRVVNTVGRDSITIAAGNGSPAGTVKTSGVIVSTVATATSAAVKVGSEVLAGGRATTKTTFAANEVILLLPGSGFAS